MLHGMRTSKRSPTVYTRRQALRTSEQIAEQRAEACAARGPGVELVSATSRKYTAYVVNSVGGGRQDRTADLRVMNPSL